VSGDAAEVSEAKFTVGVEGVKGAAACEAIASFGLASPKSISLAPAFVSMMLAGFRSRWMMPC
jgi:hypothetical protein